MHMYVVGATGVGKSKFLEHVVREDIRNWRKSECGLLLLDPHGAVYDGVR
jgi:DNA segregation ATPase FtsK/SpoIIIE-like protein